MRLNRHPAARRARVALLALAAALAALPVGPVSASPLFLSPASEGSWIAADKELHFAGSLAIAASLRVEGRSRGAALGATLSVGILKEAYDAAVKPRRMGRGASVRDLVADLAGAIAGVAIAGALDR